MTTSPRRTSPATQFAINPQQPSTSDDVNLTVVALVGVPIARIPLASAPSPASHRSHRPVQHADRPDRSAEHPDRPDADRPHRPHLGSDRPHPDGSTSRSPASTSPSLPIARIPLVDQLTLAAAERSGRPGAAGQRCSTAGWSTPRPARSARSSTAPSSSAPTRRHAAARPSPHDSPRRAQRDPRDGDDELAPHAVPDAHARRHRGLDQGGDGTRDRPTSPSLGDLTVEELLAGLGSPDVNDITLGEILNGFVAREDVAWDGLDLAARPRRRPTGGGDVTYSSSSARRPVDQHPTCSHRPPPAGSWPTTAWSTTVASSRRPPVDERHEHRRCQLGTVGFGSVVRVTVRTGAEHRRPAGRVHGAAGGPAGEHRGRGRRTHDRDRVVRAERHVRPGDDRRRWAGHRLRHAVREHHRQRDRRRPVAGARAPRRRAVRRPVRDDGRLRRRRVQPARRRGGSARSTSTAACAWHAAGQPAVTCPTSASASAATTPACNRRCCRTSRCRPTGGCTPRRSQRGTTAERIDTPALGGGIYLIQVTGFNGAHSTQPYGLRASVRPSVASPTCSTTGPHPVAQTRPTFPAAATSGATDAVHPELGAVHQHVDAGRGGANRTPS